ncbi:hypothetical protein F5J12DRAFT_811311 [Pisolithus orientalis]|uniref:uncharacterized protein n=1 Tax=Pisolithus orientalis TaxID=936130 RepID=UPI002224D602|nr:uncharacterized protein F5J12DRAFT_811311 [Pisolithus orientalis]KAI6025926.1 hypothetical protein F5J12DRAFT_811311 [Pisolithus orientalis]
MPLDSSPLTEVIEIPTSDSGEDESGLFSSPKAPSRPKKAPEQPPGDRKRKRKVVLSDDDDLLPIVITSSPAPPAKTRRSWTTSAKAFPATEKSANKHNSRSHTPSPPDRVPDFDPPKSVASPVRPPASGKPKATPMSELIRRVNSQPSSPFPKTSRPYSPLLKSSRTMLSRIAPLHPTRRTPPPPPPRPPPPKKSKKQVELEERIEEELAETIEGWSCMTEEERKELRRARLDAELGYE